MAGRTASGQGPAAQPVQVPDGLRSTCGRPGLVQVGPAVTNLPWPPGRTGRVGVWPASGTMRGREDEVRAVLELARGAAKGRGGVLLIEGELGAGKSLLLSRAA